MNKWQKMTKRDMRRKWMDKHPPPGCEKKKDLPKKRVKGAYAMFSTDYSAKHKDELKGKNVGQRQKIISAAWKNLSKKGGQKPYLEKAEKNKKAFQKISKKNESESESESVNESDSGSDSESDDSGDE